jgi:hypothetical protein
MVMRAMVGVLVIALAAQTVDPPPIPKEKWNAGDGETLWGLKASGVRYKPSQHPPTIGIAFEFGKDLNPDQVQELAMALRAQGKGGEAQLGVHFFDEDGVVMHKANRFHVEGDLTGRKGDAFRLVIPLDGSLGEFANPQEASKIKKVELRMPADLFNPLEKRATVRKTEKKEEKKVEYRK